MRSTRLTPIGAILIALVIGGLLLGAFGSKGAQEAGFIVAVFAGLAILSAGLSGGGRGPVEKSLEERREEFHPVARDEPEEKAPATNDVAEEPPNPFGR